jgi:hypothetical protein
MALAYAKTIRPSCRPFQSFFAGILVIDGMQQPPKRMLGFASLRDDKVETQQHLTL